MGNISWMYKNLCNDPLAIVDNCGTTNTEFGSSRLADNNLQSYWSADRIVQSSERAGGWYPPNIPYSADNVIDNNHGFPTALYVGIGTTIYLCGQEANLMNWQFRVVRQTAGTDETKPQWLARIGWSNILGTDGWGDTTCGAPAGGYVYEWIYHYANTPTTFPVLVEDIPGIHILFDMGSSVSVDSLIVVHNMNMGTLFIAAGGTVPSHGTADAFYGLPIYGNTGTSINFLTSPVNFRYWKLYMDGTNLSEPVKINEIFIGKKDVFPINPSYPFETSVEENITTNQAEKGQRFVYHNFSRKVWNFNYESIDDVLYGTMKKIRNYCGGSYRPFYICIDRDDNKFETFFVRFMGNSGYSEISHGFHNMNFIVEEEL